MKKSFADRRGGFTLIELLIVIIIIGVLAGMMMLAAGPATDKAKATRIISDVRTMKSAAVMYHADYGSWPLWVYAGTKYVNMDGLNNGVLPGRYFDVDPVGDGYWVGAMYARSNKNFSFAVVFLSDVDLKVRQAIAAQAEKLSIYGYAAGGHNADPRETDLRFFKAEDNELILVISK
jgi:prepilin-type N-terminal cleavage/methylation domain-containing protein